MSDGVRTVILSNMQYMYSLCSVLSAAVGRVGNLRRSGPDTIQWDPPSGAAGCISSYIHVVAGGPGGTITNSTTSTMISLSAISGDLDTCDDNLRITVTAEVPSIGAVASSMSDPPFDPTSGTCISGKL